MALYFSSRKIPQLKGLPLSERAERLEAASKQLSVPEKTLLNILKLCVFVPVFALIMRVATDWTSLLWAAGVFLLYPLLLKPIQYSLSAKYLPPRSSKERT
ncbi:hypothetical protein DXV75_14210 [Alteromonas aestuariivivens]|uniref:Uncharacterized protein n=1 Tax=Alteromonas aestuariivivens TaxID=1938339 RepID=A0A3D8M467_9ALTE|nr:DUF6170 family protein [Alteromonas aestuariivivens]RDV24431.1 hypothetical protein DXV75_14210 [Alteromonas aestuariivivens]